MNFIKRIIGSIFGMVDEDDYKLLEKQLEVAKAENSKLVETVSQKNIQITSANEKIDALKDEVTKAVDEMNEAKDALELANTEVGSLTAKVDDLLKEKEILEAKIKELEAASETEVVANLKEQIESLTKELEETKSFLDTIKTSYNDAIEELQKLYNLNNDLRNKVEESNVVIEQKDAKIAGLEAQIQNLKEVIESMNQSSPKPETVSVTVKDTNNDEVKIFVNDQEVANNESIELPKGEKMTVFAKAVDPEKQDLVVLNVKDAE